MTEAQTKLHWNGKYGQPGWYAVRTRCMWVFTKGRIHADAFKGDPSAPYHLKVWQTANSLADAQNRSLKEDDLRHAVYVLALGRNKSSKDFDNEDLDRVLAVFRMLAAPDNLAAMQEWQAYERFDAVKRLNARRLERGEPAEPLPDHPGERRRELWFIRQHGCPDKLLRERFGGRQPEDMRLSELRELVRTLKNRREYHSPASRPWSQPPELAAVPASGIDDDNQPF